jgi:hypothetical protein
MESASEPRAPAHTRNSVQFDSRDRRSNERQLLLPSAPRLRRHNPGTLGTCFSGAPETIRTCDRRLEEATLLQLSHFVQNCAPPGRCPCQANRLNQPHAPVAQLDRALPSEGKGHTFESCRVRQSARAHCATPGPLLRSCRPPFSVNGLLSTSFHRHIQMSA